MTSSERRKMLLLRAFQRQRGRCYWCNCQMKLPREGESVASNTATREHLIPQLFGGTYDKGNIRAACNQCNNRRGAEMHERLKTQKEGLSIY